MDVHTTSLAGDATKQMKEKEAMIMANDKKNDTEIKLRCSETKKASLKKRADEVGLSMSDYIRSLIFTEDNLIFLSEGAEISKALFLIHTDLEYFRDNGGIPSESVRAITEALNDVSAQLNAVSAKLTDIHKEDDDE